MFWILFSSWKPRTHFWKYRNIPKKDTLQSYWVLNFLVQSKNIKKGANQRRFQAFPIWASVKTPHRRDHARSYSRSLCEVISQCSALLIPCKFTWVQSESLHQNNPAPSPAKQYNLQVVEKKPSHFLTQAAHNRSKYQHFK